jgi:hypothetical protein
LDIVYSVGLDDYVAVVMYNDYLGNAVELADIINSCAVDEIGYDDGLGIDVVYELVDE